MLRSSTRSHHDRGELVRACCLTSVGDVSRRRRGLRTLIVRGFQRRDARRLFRVLCVLSIPILAAQLWCWSSDDASDSNALPESDPREAAFMAAHGYVGTRYNIASRETRALLEARAQLETAEFDPAIRELSKVLCLGADANTLALVASAPIEQLYPTQRLASCLHVDCGGCVGMDQTFWLSAFTSEPDVSATLPEPSQLIRLN